MKCPVCNRKVSIQNSLLAPHAMDEMVLYCPGSNRTAEDAKLVKESESR
jgi:hypothetical protein